MKTVPFLVAGLLLGAPALARPDFDAPTPAVCGNGEHVGNPFCRDGDGDDFEQDREANIVATYSSGHFCNIDGSDVLIETAFVNPGQASGSDNTLAISQNGPTTWSLDTVNSTGANLAGSASGFALSSAAGLDLDARLGNSDSQRLGGVFSDDGVNIEAEITDDGGVFHAGGYRIETTLRCVSGSRQPL